MPNFFEQDSFSVPGCGCDECIEANRLRTLRVGNRKWALDIFTGRSERLTTLIMNRLNEPHGIHEMENSNTFPTQYYLFLVPYACVQQVPASTLRHVSSKVTPQGTMFYAIASYMSDVESRKLVELHNDGYYWLNVPPPCPCEICGSLTTMPTKMGKYSVHPQCGRSDGYGHGNNKRVPGLTTEYVKLPTFSIEYEMHTSNSTSEDYQSLLVELIKYGSFKRTSDGTVTDEMVSPIYHSDRNFLTILPYLDKASHYVDSACGTHIHTGLTDYPKDFFRTHHNDFFGDLGEYLDNQEEDTSLIWGREINTWCRSGFTGDRYCWLNFDTGYDTVEYRLPRYINSKQYRMVVMFARTFTNELRTIYNDHYRQSPRKGRWTRDQGSEHFLKFYQRFENYALKHIHSH